MRRFWKYTFPSIFWMLVMAWALFGKFSKVLLPDMSLSYVDKLIHFFLFAILGGCYYWTLSHILIKTRFYSWVFFIALLAGTGVAGGTELVQEYLLDYRRGEWTDFYFDVLGVSAGALSLRWFLS